MNWTLRLFGLWLSAAVVALAATITDSDALYFLSGFLAVLPLGAWLYGRLSLQSLALHTRPATPVAAGVELAVPVEVLNSGALPRFNILVGAILPTGLSAVNPPTDHAE